MVRERVGGGREGGREREDEMSCVFLRLKRKNLIERNMMFLINKKNIYV